MIWRKTCKTRQRSTRETGVNEPSAIDGVSLLHITTYLIYFVSLFL